MNLDALHEAVALADRLQHVFVATADAAGWPHVAAAGTLTLEPDGRLAVSAWFCPGTVVNLDQNPYVGLVVWDPATDVGYQILGELEGLQDLSVLDGFAPEAEAGSPPPQIERRLVLRVERVLDFTHAPHSDTAV